MDIVGSSNLVTLMQTIPPYWAPMEQAESEQIVRAMRAAGPPVEYVIYTHEGHGFTRPENRLHFYARAEASYPAIAAAAASRKPRSPATPAWRVSRCRWHAYTQHATPSGLILIETLSGPAGGASPASDTRGAACLCLKGTCDEYSSETGPSRGIGH